MINAPYEKEFVFHDGKRAKNILELSEILDRISLEEFSQFVNTGKNDFANWTESVLNDKLLADKLRMTISYDQTRKLVRFRLQEKIIQDQSMYDSARNAALARSDLNHLDNQYKQGSDASSNNNYVQNHQHTNTPSTNISSNKESEFLLKQDISNKKITFLDKFFRRNKHDTKYDAKQDISSNNLSSHKLENLSGDSKMNQPNQSASMKQPGHLIEPVHLEDHTVIRKDHALEEYHANLLKQLSQQHDAQTTTAHNVSHEMHESYVHESNLHEPNLHESQSKILTTSTKSDAMKEDVKEIKKTKENENNKEVTKDAQATKNKWFEFFGKRHLSKNSLEHTAEAETDKHKPEEQLKDEMRENTTENWFWIILYGVLVGLIIILLLYKFVLMK